MHKLNISEIDYFDVISFDLEHPVVKAKDQTRQRQTRSDIFPVAFIDSPHYPLLYFSSVAHMMHSNNKSLNLLAIY